MRPRRRLRRSSPSSRATRVPTSRARRSPSTAAKSRSYFRVGGCSPVSTPHAFAPSRRAVSVKTAPIDPWTMPQAIRFFRSAFSSRPTVHAFSAIPSPTRAMPVRIAFTGLQRTAPEQGCADDDRAEGGELEAARGAAGQALVEEDEAGDDRDGVRRQRRDPGRRECAAALVAALEEARPEAVPGQEGQRGEQPRPAVADELRGHVADGEEEPAGEA